jgi:hypothetical protein
MVHKKLVGVFLPKRKDMKRLNPQHLEYMLVEWQILTIPIFEDRRVEM